jgi:hypothetical protein
LAYLFFVVHKVFTGNEHLVEMFSLALNNSICHNPCITVAGTMLVSSRSNLITGNEPLDDIEDWLFRVLERLKESLNGGKTP